LSYETIILKNEEIKLKLNSTNYTDILNTKTIALHGHDGKPMF